MLVRRGGAVERRPTSSCSTSALAARTAAPRPHALDASLTATMAPSMVATRPLDAPSASSGFSGTCSTWRRSSSTATPAISAPTSSRSAACSTRCSPAARRSRAPASLNGDRGDHEQRAAADRRARSRRTRCSITCCGAASRRIRERRWQSIGDVTGELRWIRDHPDGAAGRRRAAGAPSRVGECAIVADARPRGGRAWPRRARPLRGRGAAPDLPVAALRDLHRADRRSVDGAVAGRHADRLRRQPGSRADALGPLARRHREPRARRAPKAPAFRSGRPTAARSGSSPTTS